MTELIKIEKLCAGYGRQDIIKDISLSADKGEFVALLGPNGGGKTTLLRAVLGLLKISSGSVFLSGEDAKKMTTKNKSKKLSFIPQVSSPLEGFSVEEIIAMGRNPHDTGSEADLIAIDRSIEKVNLKNLRNTDVSRISGGEYQRVLIARALAQETDIMLLDEPTAHLDIKYRIETMRTLRALKAEKLIIGVFHDIDLVKDFADRVVLMKSGKIAADGEVSQVLSPVLINEVFDITSVA
ncbi:MAG: ABC transporter ATP-binding protein [Candidatus Margulisiibacteriota bacterium]